MQSMTQTQYDASPERVDIRVLRIYEEPILVNGVPKGMDLMCEYAPTGTDDMTRMTRRVKDLLNVDNIDDPDSVMHNMAKARAAAIARALEYHKRSETVPDGHLALETWAGLTPIMVRALKQAGIRSLQELQDASEPTIARISVPNPRKLIEHCRMYLASIDRTASAAQDQRLLEENEFLRTKVSAMEQKFNDLLDRLQLNNVAPQHNSIMRQPVPDAMAGVRVPEVAVAEDEGMSEDVEQAIRNQAKAAGIKSWHIKSVERLQEELNALAGISEAAE